MPPRRSIPDLLDLSLAQLRPLVALEALRVARVAVTKFVYDEIEAGYDGAKDRLRDSKPLDVDENIVSALTRTKKPFLVGPKSLLEISRHAKARGELGTARENNLVLWCYPLLKILKIFVA